MSGPGGGGSGFEPSNTNTPFLTASNGLTVTGSVEFANEVTFNNVAVFEGDLTASQGMLIPDDQFLRFGTTSDVTVEYDESGNDVLTFEANKDGAHSLLVKNTFAGTSANARIQVQADGGAGLNIAAYDDGHSNAEFADKGVLFTDTGVTALAIMGRNCNVEIYAGGDGAANKKMILDTNSKISLSNNDAGTSNTILGKTAAASLASGGNYNLIIGEEAGTTLTTGDDNTLMGYKAGNNLTTGSLNVAIGREALFSEQGGSGSIAIGSYALYSQNISGSEGSVTNNLNTAIGINAGYNITTGSANIAIGADAMYNNSLQNGCVAIGNSALYSMKIDAGWNFDDFVGRPSAGNTAVGEEAGFLSTTSLDSTFIGSRAGKGTGPCVGNFNTFIGSNAGSRINGFADNNILVGAFAGSDFNGTANELTTGDNNIMIGNKSDFSVSDAQDQIIIGSSLVGTSDTRVHIGNGTSHIYNDFNSNATWTHSSDERQKTNIQDDILGLNFINNLRTVTYTNKSPSEFPEEWQAYDPEDTEPMGGGNIIHGFIAQEVKEALDKVGCDTFGGWDINPDGRQGVSFEAFVMPLVKAVQELSAKVSELEAKLED